MQAAMMATSARLRLISLGLIVGGLALAIGPAALIRGLDNYVSRTRERDVDLWTELDGSATLPSISGPVIEPGPEGYLLEIPKIGVRVIVHTLEPEALLGRNTPLLKRHGVGQIPLPTTCGMSPPVPPGWPPSPAIGRPPAPHSAFLIG